MLVNVVRRVGQADYVLATNMFGKGVGVALVGCVALGVVDDRSSTVGAGLGNRGYDGGLGSWRSMGGVVDIVEPLVGSRMRDVH